MPLENRLNFVNAANRRGLLLGLTLSEIMIIILFALLLLFGDEISEQDATRSHMADLETALAEVTQISDDEISTVDHIKSTLSEYGLTPNEIKDIFHEMEISKKIQAEIKSLEDQSSALAQKQDAESKKRLEAIQQELQKKKTELAIMKKARSGEAIDHKSVAEQAKYWKSRWETEAGNGKKGVNPCWVTNGAVDFIFDVALTDNGMIVRKNMDVPQWADDYERLPVNEIPFMTQISQGDFVSRTRPLFDYSVKKDCRFFVRLYDETSATAKLLYQQRRRSVEGHFFILDMKDVRFGGI